MRSSGLPKMVAVNSLEIQRALEAQVMNILEGIKSILEKTPPELVAAINDHGIILTGGVLLSMVWIALLPVLLVLRHI